MSSARQKVQESNDQTAIRAVIESVAQAHYDKNAAGIVAPYAPDAELYSLAPPLRHVGMKTNEIQAWLDTWEGPIEREVRDLKIGSPAISRWSTGIIVWVARRNRPGGRSVSGCGRRWRCSAKGTAARLFKNMSLLRF